MVGCLSSVSIWKIIYKFSYACPFDYTDFVVSGKVGYPFNSRFNHTSWMEDVTSTDCPKSVHNCCVIEVFGGVFVLSIGFFFSVGIRT